MWPRGHGKWALGLAWAGHTRHSDASVTNRAGTGHRYPRVSQPHLAALIGGNFLMSDALKVAFVPLSAAANGILVVFCDETLKVGPVTRKALGKAVDLIKRAAEANQFKGKNASTLDILAPEGVKIQRLIVVGTGKPSELQDKDFLKFGGVIAGKLNAASRAMSVLAELPEAAMSTEQAVALATGLRLRTYRFTRYKTRKKDGED